MSRREFSAKVKAQAALRARGHCEKCTRKLLEGDFHYDHDIPDGLDGEPTLDNCRVLCRSCHSAKTARIDVPTIAKAKRNFKKARGIRRPRTITRWRKMNGTAVYASRER